MIKALFLETFALVGVFVGKDVGGASRTVALGSWGMKTI